MQFRSRKKAVYLTLLLVLIIVCCSPFLVFVHDIINDHDLDVQRLESSEENERIAYIPKTIHQMFFNISNEKIPNHLTDAQRSWEKLNPDFQYILWNSSMVENLMRQKYPSYLEVYKSYTHWVQRADFARYIVLHQHGGIYADIDIECVQNMSKLNSTLPKNTEFVMYWTQPYGVSNDFLISRPGDSFITFVINGLARANRWYVTPYLTVFLSTGPFYIYGRYLAFKEKQNIFILTNTEMLRYLKHEPGASWHEMDGKILWWLYSQTYFITIFLPITLIACLLVLLLWKYRVFSLYTCWKSVSDYGYSSGTNQHTRMVPNN